MRETYHLYVGVGNKWIVVQITKASWEWYLEEAEKQGAIVTKDRPEQNVVDYYRETDTDYDFFGYIRRYEAENV